MSRVLKKKAFLVITQPKSPPFPQFPRFLPILNSKDLQEMLLGNFNPYTEKLEIPKSYQVFSNFKKRVLNPAYKELKEKGDYYFEYELIKTGKKVISLNFQILKNGEGEKIGKDFHKKKKLFIY